MNQYILLLLVSFISTTGSFGQTPKKFYKSHFGKIDYSKLESYLSEEYLALINVKKVRQTFGLFTSNYFNEDTKTYLVDFGPEGKEKVTSCYLLLYKKYCDGLIYCQNSSERGKRWYDYFDFSVVGLKGFHQNSKCISRSIIR